MFKIVPIKVQIKVFCLILLSATLILFPFWIPTSVWIQIALFLFLTVLGAYLLWCFWPKFRFGLTCSDIAKEYSQNLHFSFDDGPTPLLTDKVLDLLQTYHQKASFFVLVDKAIEHPELIQRIVKDGHILGLHGQNHALPFFRKKNEIKDTLLRAKQTLEGISGQKILLYRPSHGWKNIFLVQVIHQLELRFSFWNWGVWDTDAPSLKVLSDRLSIATALALKGRQKVILLHDGRGDEIGFPKHGTVLLESLQMALKTSMDR